MIWFAEWLPDTPDFGGDSTVIKNVIAGAIMDAKTGATSYKQFLSFANTITALAERVQGAIAVKADGGGAYVYAGTASSLRELGPGLTAFVDRSGSSYTCAAHERWAMARYGSRVYAGHIGNDIQYATIGAGTNFAQLSASAPRCRHMAVFGLFLMCANTWDSTDGYRPNRLWWPAIDNPASWPTIGSDAAAQVQSDLQDLPDGGAITGLVGGETGGYVVTETKIYRATYPTSTIFDFTPVELNRGSRFPGSVIGDGRLVFYLGDDGFYMFDGAQSVPIGSQKVDHTFLADLDAVHIPRICAAIDPVNKLVMWAYPGPGNSAGNPSKIIIYNWAIGRWSYVQTDLEYLVAGMSLGYTLDSLDSLGLGLDSIPYSLDSYVWQGGEPKLIGFDTSHRMGYFSGSAMQATLTTGETQLSEGQRSLVSSVRPLVSDVGTTITVTPITRNRLIDSVTTGTASTINAVGECPMLSEGRYHRFQMDITGGFTHALGLDPSFTGSGNA